MNDVEKKVCTFFVPFCDTGDGDVIDPAGLDMSFIDWSRRCAVSPVVTALPEISRLLEIELAAKDKPYTYAPSGHYDKSGNFVIDEISIVPKR